MGSCASCGAAEVAPGQVCPQCGAAQLELALEHSNDASAYGLSPAGASKPPLASALAPFSARPPALAFARTAPVPSLSPSSLPPPPPAVDLVADARLLADYGPPPRHWLLTPAYAWRVMKRRRELRAALLKRRE